MNIFVHLNKDASFLSMTTYLRGIVIPSRHKAGEESLFHY